LTIGHSNPKKAAPPACCARSMGSSTARPTWGCSACWRRPSTASTCRQTPPCGCTATTFQAWVRLLCDVGGDVL